jgi:protein O-GlcNAc transferase
MTHHPEPAGTLPRTPPADAGELWWQLRASARQASVWLALARDYRHHALPWQAGHAARQALRCDPAVRPQLDALDLGPWQDPAAGDAQLGRPTLPQASALVDQFSARTRTCPGDWLTWLYLARLHELQALVTQEPPPKPAAAPAAHTEALARATALEAIAGESLHWLGVWRLNAGDAEGAVTASPAWSTSARLRHGSMMYLGEALLRVGNVAAAEKAFSRASLSANPDFLLNLAARVYAHNYWQEAIAVLHKALALRPQHVPTWLALARIQSEVYALADCRASLDRLHALAPGHPEAALLAAGLHGRMGDARAHLAALQAAYASGDPLSRLASSVAMTALYHDELPAGRRRRPASPLVRADRSVGGREDRLPEHALDRAAPAHRLRHRRPAPAAPGQPLHAAGAPAPRPIGASKSASTTPAACSTPTPARPKAAPIAGAKRRLDDRRCSRRSSPTRSTSWSTSPATPRRTASACSRCAPRRCRRPSSATRIPPGCRIDWLIGDAPSRPANTPELFSEGIAQLPDCVFCWAPVDDYPLPRPRPAAAPVVFARSTTP